MFTRQGRLIRQEVKLEFKCEPKVTKQTGRRILIQLQEEVERLIKEGHIEKVTEVTDKQFIRPVVIIVKRDKSVRIALDARALNNEITKNKYQMPNLEHLSDMVAEQLDKTNNGIAWYISLDLIWTIHHDTHTDKYHSIKELRNNATFR